MKKFHFVSLLFSVLLISCSMLNQTPSSSIVVNLPQTATRGPAPDFVSYYKVTASCEEIGFNKTEIPEKGKSSVEFINLKAGTYKVQVVAFTADDEKVAEGEDTVEVAAGEVAVAKILLEIKEEPEIKEPEDEPEIKEPEEEPKEDEPEISYIKISYETPYGGVTEGLRSFTGEHYILTDDDVFELSFEGLKFCGWYFDEAYTAAANVGDGVSSDITLYAKWEEGFDMGLSVYNPALSVWYESDVENEFIQDANAPVEIPYKNENLVIRLSNVGYEFEEIEFKLNNGNIEFVDPYTIKINPYENVLLTLDGTNVLFCVVTDGRISKSVSFIFRFTDTGL